jgi:hypothetical protein
VPDDDVPEAEQLDASAESDGSEEVGDNRSGNYRAALDIVDNED